MLMGQEEGAFFLVISQRLFNPDIFTLFCISRVRASLTRYSRLRENSEVPID